jgi:hypothetical protein
MARLMEQFEALIEPHLPPGARTDSAKFKGIARDTIKEFAGDASDVYDALASGQEVNGVAVELRDQVGAR